MSNEIYRNRVSITNVKRSQNPKKGKCFAFGVIMQPKPRSIFFPRWIVEAFDITDEDAGYEFDCLFIDREQDKHPCVVAIIEDGELEMSEVVGFYEGQPGSDHFEARINHLNRRSA